MSRPTPPAMPLANDDARQVIAAFEARPKELPWSDALLDAIIKALTLLGLVPQAIEDAVLRGEAVLLGHPIGLAPIAGKDILLASIPLPADTLATPNDRQAALRANLRLTSMLRVSVALVSDRPVLLGRFHLQGFQGTALAAWLAEFIQLSQAVGPLNTAAETDATKEQS